ncbi:MAG: retropepsin-like aspartic protease [Sphingomonadaceae bacterium]|nr:retropepsin-like aspartic protease [Sphingomonadaceae bacterium]
MRHLLPLAALLSLAACDQVMTSTPDYRPQDAGSVDQAMCLLGFTAVPLTELVTGHHLVGATINGVAGIFVLDTGANASVVNTAAAGQFGLTPALGGLVPAIGIGVGGAQKAGFSTADSLVIGGVDIRRKRLMTANLDQVVKLLGPMAGGAQISGIIGQDVMKEHRAVIDVAKPILYLIAADADSAPVEASACGGAADGAETEAAPAR